MCGGHRGPGARRVVIGVGNPWRRDDGVGHRVVEDARRQLPDDVEVALLDGEPTGLLDTWEGTDLAVVVDGVHTGGTPGTVQTIDLLTDALVTPTSVSSHCGGIAEAVELGRVLGRLPDRLILIGVEIADDGDGRGLSPRVDAAVDVGVRAVLEALSTDEGAREGGAPECRAGSIEVGPGPPPGSATGSTRPR